MLDVNQLFPGMSPDVLATLEAAPKDEDIVMAGNDFLTPLAADDKRYVDTTAARNDKFKKHFLRTLGYNPDKGSFTPKANGQHMLFFGHVGCGKSTELKHFCEELHHPGRYWVVRVDLLDILDPHNVRYCDVWLAVAQALLQQLQKDDIKVDDFAFSRLSNWFHQRVLTHEKMREFSADLKTEVKAGFSLPALVSLFASFTSALRLANTRRETIREVINNSYGEFIGALNQLFAAVKGQLIHFYKGQQILVVIDGPDRFRGEDWKRFFVDDGIQLTQAECATVYTAPLALLHHGLLLPHFDHVVLPMVKLIDFDTRQKQEVAYSAMRLILLKRCHYSLFDSKETLDTLIDYSGGNVRDALRLLNYTCREADSTPFDLATVQAAANKLAADYRNWLLKEDYPLLAEEDLHATNAGNSEAISRLIEQGALLQYNGGNWRQAHPAIKLLSAYTAAAQALTTAAGTAAP